MDELKELDVVSSASTDMGRPTPQMSSRPSARRTAGWTWSHQNDQNASHSLGMSSSEKPACSSRLFQTWTWLVCAHRQRVQGPLSGPGVEQHGPVERVRIEQVREVADGVREVNQPILEAHRRM